MKQIYVTMTTWHGLLWLCLRQHPSEASVKISSESDLFWLIFREDFSVGLVCFETISINVSLTAPYYFFHGILNFSNNTKVLSEYLFDIICFRF